MGFTLPTANAGGDAPEVADGLALLRFDDLVLKDHPDWAGTDKFGKPDDGKRFHFLFSKMASPTEVEYQESGDPLELDALTRTATGEKSNFAKIMSGILTAQEFAAWQAATAEAPFDASAAKGRLVNAKIAHNTKGWPFVEAVISPFVAVAAKKKTKAEVLAELAALEAAETVGA